MLRNNLMLPTEALDIPEAIDFDGTNDYLSRSSDLVGNADGKTFTFSVWCDFRKDLASSFCKIYTNSGSTSYGFFVNYSPAGNNINFRAFNASGTVILDATATFKCNETFFNIVCSIDLTNTSKRSVYINDTPASVGYATYVNDTIAFAYPTHYISFPFLGQDFKGRLSNFYLDYQYRDLSIESNRRLFITADRKPAANQQALNPILYLPLNDPTQPGKNLGTGGDFNLTGVVARSGRGPNQFNAPYSDLDGSVDYLSRTSIAGIADSKTITISANFMLDSLGGNGTILSFLGPGAPNPYKLYVLIGSSGELRIDGWADTTDANSILQSTTVSGSIVPGRNYVLAASIDMSNSNKRHVYLNGVLASTAWTAYTNVNIDLTGDRYGIGSMSYAAMFLDGRLGNVFFDTKYIDLSVPANLAKFVTGTGIDAKPADLGANGELPFGTAPLIYLPMYGNNAGKNYGTGGDFTVNSGPYPGARGPNEFWGNKADFDGSTGKLTRTSALTGVLNSKTFSLSLFGTEDSFSGTDYILDMETSGGSDRLNIYATASLLTIQANNSSGSPILDWQISSHGIVDATPFYMTLQIDLTNQTNCKLYINGVQKTGTFYAFANDFIDLAGSSRVSIGRDYTGSSGWDGKLSEFYFTTDYIDFSQEANRLKFRDAFGNPVALQPQIEAGTLPNPAIYMRFPPDNFGKNYGTGGDFTVNGIITDGGQL